jgi:steroid delta-isomerase-like uncharacterized protein
MNDLKSIVTKFYEHYNAHDIDKVLEIWADDPVYIMPGEARAQGFTEISTILRGLFNAFPDEFVDVEHIVIEGNVCFVSYIDNGTFTGPLGPVPPNGRRFAAAGATKMIFDDNGKVVLWQDYMDLYTWFQRKLQIYDIPGYWWKA